MCHSHPENMGIRDSEPSPAHQSNEMVLMFCTGTIFTSMGASHSCSAVFKACNGSKKLGFAVGDGIRALTTVLEDLTGSKEEDLLRCPFHQSLTICIRWPVILQIMRNVCSRVVPNTVEFEGRVYLWLFLNTHLAC